MCTTAHSHPPIEPISGASVDAQALQLQSEDGATFRAFLARPAQSTGAGIVILPDVRGLVPFFEELAMRFAERGIDAIAFDYFCRTAGSDARDADWEYGPHVEQTQWTSLQADIRTAVTHLRGLDRPARSIFTTGFCMGGRLTSLSATLGLGLAGGIPFYGWPVGQGRGGMPAPADVASKIECDLLLIYGGADHGISKEVRDTYDKALDKAGVHHETLVYDGAPHSFFDRTAEAHAEASADAWDKTLAFIRRHTQGRPIAG
jgi:carboxymethylenebutenolidase